MKWLFRILCFCLVAAGVNLSSASAQQATPGQPEVEGRRSSSRLHVASQRRQNPCAFQAAREDSRPRMVPESFHCWLNGRMQGPP